MTAKSRRHKLDKKRKSDEHPQPRHREEDRRRPEGSRGRTGLIPRKREGDVAADEGSEQAPREIRNARLLEVSLTGDLFAPGWVESIDGVPTEQEAAIRDFEERHGYQLTTWQRNLYLAGRFGHIESRVGQKGSYWDVTVPGDLPSLNVVDPESLGIVGYPEGAKLYLTDGQKELFEGLYREYKERHAGGKEGVRTAGASDSASSAG